MYLFLTTVSGKESQMSFFTRVRLTRSACVIKLREADDDESQKKAKVRVCFNFDDQSTVMLAPK